MRRALPGPLEPLREFLRTESASGVLLVVASGIAMVWANLSRSYEALWASPLPLHLSPIVLELDARHWINDAAMALFFFVVGLEIKRELIDGELRDRRQAMLPVIAAFGGMVAPALIYLVFNLLALVLEREPVNIAALAFDSDDTYLRGTALEYLETVLPSGIFAALAPRLSTSPAPVLPQRGAAVVRAELLEAAATMRMSRRQLLEERSAPDLDAEQ